MINVTNLDFTWERREELIRKEEREEGFEESVIDRAIQLLG